MTDASKPLEPAAKPATRSAPGRTIGFSVMTVMILFAGFWMQRQSELVNTPPTSTATTPAAAPVGFRADAWFLPDEELLGFVAIPAGSFIMGSNPVLDPLAYENERWSAASRQGTVDVDAFYIGRYEVTVAQFRAFAVATHLMTGTDFEAMPGNLPVSNITWPEALAYGRWLEQQLRESNLTPAALREHLDNGAHVTLATEAEWEKAARGTDGRVFPWGSERSSSFANFDSGTPIAVGSLPCPECSYGLSDMSGNVWEFTRSPLQDYPYDSSDDYADLDSDPLWVMRGGSYADPVNNVRTAVRGGVDPGVRSPGIGFRVVISSN